MVGGPLGPLLRVDSLKVARQNPLILEMDLGLNANLGVVEVESVRVRMPIDPPGMPTIIPTAISVNIPGALVGSGYLDIRDNGFAGALDLTLVPLKLRIQASAGLERLDVGDRQHHRVLPRARRRVPVAHPDRELGPRALRPARSVRHALRA